MKSKIYHPSRPHPPPPPHPQPPIYHFVSVSYSLPHTIYMFIR